MFTTPSVRKDPLELRLGPFYLKQFLAEAAPDLDLDDIAPHLDVLQQAEPHRVLTDLRQAGFRNPTATDVITVVNAPTAADLVRWTFTCATRVFWNVVPEPRRSQYAQQMAERIESEFSGRPPQYDTVSRVYLGTK